MKSKMINPLVPLFSFFVYICNTNFKWYVTRFKTICVPPHVTYWCISKSEQFYKFYVLIEKMSINCTYTKHVSGPDTITCNTILEFRNEHLLVDVLTIIALLVLCVVSFRFYFNSFDSDFMCLSELASRIVNFRRRRRPFRNVDVYEMI